MKKGQRHGQGILKFSSGNVYKGEFNNDKRHGYGEFFYQQTGEKYVGFWENDMREGRGQYYFQDGSIFRGNFHQDLKHGKGQKKSKKLSYNGYWKNGLKHGIFKFEKNETKEVSMAEYRNNKLKKIKKLNNHSKNKTICNKSSDLKKQSTLKKTKKIKKIKNKINSRLINRKIKKKFKGTNNFFKSKKKFFENNSLKILNKKLCEIKEESETCLSIISHQSKRQNLFSFIDYNINLQQNIDEKLIETKMKWKSGYNLLNDKKIRADCFRFTSETEFDKIAFKKSSKNIFDIEIESTVDGSCDELNNSQSFVSK